MAVSKIVVANMALAHIGSQATIGSLTEKSQEAKVCNLFIEQVRLEVFEDYPWPRLTTHAQLTQVSTDPTLEWSYSYRLPSDCIKVQRIITSYGGEELHSQRAQFKIFSDSSGALLYTNWDDEVTIEYTWDNQQWEHLSAQMARAISAKLAYYIVPRLTAGDPYNIQEKVAGLYLQALNAEAGNAFNEENTDYEGDTESVVARE